ncbi:MULTISPECIES: hypothetical protein [Sphingomonas]|uniref:hypothetical protein n=1 Tax=Sphingomonas TaxID=13687 RepID=UPI000DEF5BD6|nr:MULTISPECIES: hypothetical protein [Sphingomonas]
MAIDDPAVRAALLVVLLSFVALAILFISKQFDLRLMAKFSAKKRRPPLILTKTNESINRRDEGGAS